MCKFAALISKMVEYVVRSYFAAIGVSLKSNGPKRIRRNSRNYHKHIKHPFDGNKSIIRRSRFAKDSIIDMSLFAESNDIQQGDSIYFINDSFINDVISMIMIITFVALAFPISFLGLMNFVLFVAIITFIMISFVAENMGLICGNTSLSIDASDVGQSPIIINLPYKSCTAFLYLLIFPYFAFDYTKFYVSFEHHVIPIRDDIYLNDFNIWPRNDPYQLRVHGVGGIGGAPIKDNKEIQEYLNVGSLLAYQLPIDNSLDVPPEVPTPYRLGEIIAYDQFKFCFVSLQRSHPKKRVAEFV